MLLNELADASFYHANCRIIFVSSRSCVPPIQHHLRNSCTAHLCVLCTASNYARALLQPTVIVPDLHGVILF